MRRGSRHHEFQLNPRRRCAQGPDDSSLGIGPLRVPRLAFCLSVPWVLAFLAKNGYLPMMFGFRALGGPFESLGRGPFVVAGWMLVAVSLLDVIAGVLLWRGRRRGALLGLASDPIALALGWGFALPLLLVGVPVRALLVIVAMRRIRRRGRPQPAASA